MTDTLSVLQNIRHVIGRLSNCRELVVNKQKKAEFEKVIQELRVLEDSLLVKNPLLATSASRRSTFEPPSLQSFKVYTENNRLNDLPSIEKAAYAQYPSYMAPSAIAEATQMKEMERQAKIDAQINQLTSEASQDAFINRPLSPDELFGEVKRFVAGKHPIVATTDAEKVAFGITQQILRNRGLR